MTNLSLKIRNFRQWVHVVDKKSSKFFRLFYSYCPSKMYVQLVLGSVRFSVWPNNCKNIVLRYSMANKQCFCEEESLIWRKHRIQGRNLSNSFCRKVQYYHNFVEFVIMYVLSLSFRLTGQIRLFWAGQTYQKKSIFCRIQLTYIIQLSHRHSK